MAAVIRGLQTTDSLKEEAEKKLEDAEFKFEEKTVQLEFVETEAEQLKLQISERWNLVWQN